MGSVPVRRMDLFIPEIISVSRYLRETLDMDHAFYQRDGARINRLPISNHLLRILQHWTLSLDNPQEMYTKAPFGSRIVLGELPKDPFAAKITIAPTHYLERQLLSAKSLQAAWGPTVKFPPTIDLDQLSHVEQLHDSVCLVRIEGKLFILKALTSYTKFLYHELRHLLTIPSHPNVMSRPIHLVTKKCGFGNKTGVVGFTLEYHVHGSIRDLLPFYHLHGLTSLAEQVKWSLQLVSALIHVRQTTGTFYPDLRLDNLVLSKSRDIVMVDFEQRGVWCEFAAPELNAIDYMRIIAVDQDIPTDVSQRYGKILSKLLPNWEKLERGEEYKWPSKGYNVPWKCLTPTEQEACEVYMLGRVLWCIFEATSAPQRAALWLSYKWEPLVDFPSYTKTPPQIQDLIDLCTRGRRDTLSSLVVRKQDHMVLRSLEHTDDSTPQEVQAVAREFWKKEVSMSEGWIKARALGMQTGRWKENYYDRPTLVQVQKTLQEFYSQVSGSGFKDVDH